MLPRAPTRGRQPYPALQRPASVEPRAESRERTRTRAKEVAVSTAGGRSGSPSRSARRGTWALGEDEAGALLTNARRAFFVMVGVLAVLWILQIVNFADGYQLSQQFGLTPRHVPRLPYILTAPFLHASWTHIEGNSGPLFIFGFLGAYRGVAKFAAVTAIVAAASGLAAWFFEPARTVGVGASGVVFGYFGYIMVRGLFGRHAIDVLVGAVMALCFAYQFAVLLPHQGIGWQAHVGGLVGGIGSGYLLRDRRSRRDPSADRRGTLPNRNGGRTWRRRGATHDQGWQARQGRPGQPARGPL